MSSYNFVPQAGKGVTVIKRGYSNGNKNNAPVVEDGNLAKRRHTGIHDQKSPSIAPDDLTNAYLHILPNPAGLEFLRSSTFSGPLQKIGLVVASSNGDTVDECIEEFRRFIAIKAFTSDEFATKISPTPLMDDIWRAAILDTQFYVKLQKALGITLHHRPEGATECEYKQKRLAAMTALYKTFFKTEPITFRALAAVNRSQIIDSGSGAGFADAGAGGSDGEQALFPISVFVKTLTGWRIEIRTDKYARAEDIKEAVRNREGCPLELQSLTFRGREQTPL